MNIDFDEKKNIFVITCPFHANDLVTTLPSRQWSKPRRAWTAKPIRQNAEKLAEFAQLAGCVATPVAIKAIYATLDKGKIQAKSRVGVFPAWYTFKSKKPRAHQWVCMRKMYGLPAFAIHADMGTGKTFMILNEACALRMEGKIDCLLVIVKLAGRLTWVEQIGEHATIPIDYMLADTDKPRQFEQWLAKKHDFKCLIIGTESLSQGQAWKMMARFLAVHSKPYGVVDESHLIANEKSTRTEKVIETRPSTLIRRTMSGTPVKQNPLDLYAPWEYLDPDVLGFGDYYAFRNHFAVMGGYREKNPKTGQYGPPKEVIGFQNLDELAKMLAPYTFECLKADVLDLPPKVYHKRGVTLTKEQKAMYDEIRRDGAFTVHGFDEHVIENALEKELRLHQVAQGFATTYTEEEIKRKDGSIKIKRTPTWHPIVPWAKNPKIKEVVDIARDNVQHIIWASYRPALQAIVDALHNAYPKESVIQIHGDISEKDRETWRQEYQKGKHKYMVGNEQTGGQSATWTACGTMTYFDNTNKLIDRLQSEDRAHRDGLTHTVNYVDIIVEGTVDALRLLAVKEKMDLAMYVRTHIREAAEFLNATG